MTARHRPHHSLLSPPTHHTHVCYLPVSLLAQIQPPWHMGQTGCPGQGHQGSHPPRPPASGLITLKLFLCPASGSRSISFMLSQQSNVAGSLKRQILNF